MPGGIRWGLLVHLGAPECSALCFRFVSLLASWSSSSSFVKDRAFPPNSVNERTDVRWADSPPVAASRWAHTHFVRLGWANKLAPPPTSAQRRARFCVILCVECQVCVLAALPCALSSRAPASFFTLPSRVVGSFRGFFAPLCRA